MNFDITHALTSLRPGAEWRMNEEKYETLEWNSSSMDKPTKEELEDEVQRLQAEWDSKEYQRLRSQEYPPVADYLDAVVKGDLEQQQAYIDACLAVKAKYPKVSS